MIDDLYTKWKFITDFVEKAKLKKRKMTGGQEDAKVSSKKARYDYEEIRVSDDESETESDDSDDSEAIKFFLALDDSSSSSLEEF